jgi:hypothetical protein
MIAQVFVDMLVMASRSLCMKEKEIRWELANLIAAMFIIKAAGKIQITWCPV